MCMLNSAFCILDNVWTFTLSNIELIPTSIGVWIAYQALTTWKKEYVGKQDIDLARDVLESFSEMQLLISAVRNPMYRIDETALENWHKQITQNMSDTPPNFFLNALWPVYLIAQNQNEIMKWDKICLRARIRFEASFFQLNKDIHLILKNICDTAWDRARNIEYDRKKNDKTLFQVETEDDISITIDNIVREVEKNLMPLLPKKHGWKKL